MQWACARIGAILVTLNPAYRDAALVQVNILNLVGVSHLFVVPRMRSSAYISSLSAGLPALANSTPGDIQEPSIPTLKHLVIVDNTPSPHDFEKEMEQMRCGVDLREVLVWREDSAEKRRVEEIMRGLDARDVINLQFTSGTTGAPKAVSLTHHNLLNNALSISAAMKITPDDILCNVPPLFHCFGLVLGNLALWSRGAAVVYASETFDARAIVDALVEEGCTAIHGVPTHFLAVLSEVQRRMEEGDAVDTRRLRTGIAAGSPIPIDLMKQLVAKMNLAELSVAFGMTETSPVAFQSSTEDPLEKRVETVGRVQPHVKAKIIDNEGNIVPVNTPGEVLIAGYNLHKGYWGDEEHTKAALSTDKDATVWLHTGDEGVLDEEGYLKIVGRIKDIIIRGGENLFPVQIENVLTANPAVREAAVVAVPDQTYGEVVGAWVMREPGKSCSKEEVRNTVASGMNPQNSPAWVWFVGEDGVPEEIPKTASGKVMKHVLREWSRDLAKKDVGRVGA